MKDKSISTKIKEKQRKKYWNDILKNSNIITLDAKWYEDNVRRG